MWPQLGGTKISVSTQHQTWQWEIHLITYKLWFRHVSTEKASLNGGFSIATFDCRLVITLEYGKVQVSSINKSSFQVPALITMEACCASSSCVDVAPS